MVADLEAVLGLSGLCCPSSRMTWLRLLMEPDPPPAGTNTGAWAWRCVPPSGKLVTWQLFLMEGPESHPHCNRSLLWTWIVFPAHLSSSGITSISSQDISATTMMFLRALLLVRELR